MKKVISKVNKLLIKYFGLPKRNNVLPDPIDLLIATILSQNTNDTNSFSAYSKLKNLAPSWEITAKLPRSSIEKQIKTAGLGKQKSYAIKNLLTTLIKSRGVISLSYLKKLTDEEVISELRSFKGIGLKTATCVLLFSFDRNVCPVDTHVHRVLNRLGIVNTKMPEKTYYAVNPNLPENAAHSFHTNLIRLGREVCKPSNPLCGLCPLVKICSYSEKNYTRISPVNENKFMLLDNIS
jgi:endonuclease-3